MPESCRLTRLNYLFLFHVTIYILENKVQGWNEGVIMGGFFSHFVLLPISHYSPVTQLWAKSVGEQGVNSGVK